MTGWEMNRDTVKAYLSSLTLSENVRTALESAADACEDPTVSDVSRVRPGSSISLSFVVVLFDR